MAEKTKNREELKAYFVKNSIPKEYQFKDLINAMINQGDDGIVKEQDQPLSVAASGEAASEKKVLRLYQDFDKPAPDWTLSLNPATGPGLNISDGGGKSRLFIDRNTGNVGIGLTAPKAKLDIQHENRTGTHSSEGKTLYVTGKSSPDGNGVEFRHSNGTQGIGFGYNTIYAAGSNDNQDLNLKARGTGMIKAMGSLLVNGPIRGHQKGALRIKTDSGYVDVGSKNEEWSHFYTDRTKYYFDKEIRVDTGLIGSYNENLSLSTSGTPRITVRNDNGNVGIGMTDPNNELVVNGTIEIQVNDADSKLLFHDPGQSWYSMGIDQSDAGNFKINYGGDIGAANHFTMTRDGNTGIGAFSPGQKLVVQSNLNAGKHTGHVMTHSGSLAIVSNAPQIDFIDTDHKDWAIHVNANKMYFVREPWEYNDLVLDGAGNVGVGTDNPGAKLEIAADTTTAGGWYEAIRFGQNAHSAITHPGGGLLFGLHGNRNFYFADIKDGTFQKYVMQISADSGTVHLSRLLIASKWLLSETAKDDWLRIYGASNNAYYGGLAAGKLWTSSGGGLVSGSDIRLKKNIEPVADALERVLALRGVNFNWRNEEHDRGMGLIAQEVEEIFPEAVQDGPDGMKGINYANLIAPLIEAVKTQQEEIKTLRLDLAALKAA